MLPSSALIAVLIASLDPRVEELLAAPARSLASTPKGTRIIALSNLAEYCAHADAPFEAQKRCLRGLAQTALSKGLRPLGELATAELGDHGLYLSHLNIVLGEYERVVRDGRYRAINERISRHLAAKTLAAKNKHVASFPSEPARWPADQTATLFSLHLYDENFGAELSKEPILAFFTWLDAHGMDAKLALPKSEITGAHATSNLPRGCALSFMVRYMAAFAPDRARALWDAYVDKYEVDYGAVVGLREWPPGVERKSDIDSGPIVAGIGVAASAFGIGAAHAVGDEVRYTRLVVSAEVAKTMSGDLDATAKSALATGIELAGRTEPR